jgi:hypothetical protein
VSHYSSPHKSCDDFLIIQLHSSIPYTAWHSFSSVPIRNEIFVYSCRPHVGTFRNPRRIHLWDRVFRCKVYGMIIRIQETKRLVEVVCTDTATLWLQTYFLGFCKGKCARLLFPSQPGLTETSHLNILLNTGHILPQGLELTPRSNVPFLRDD